MRTILHEFGTSSVESLGFSELTSKCFVELGLQGSEAPKSAAEGKVRKMADYAKKIIIVANELRNLVGTGHGKVVGTEDELSSLDASMIASNGMILSAWLIRVAESRDPQESLV